MKLLTYLTGAGLQRLLGPATPVREPDAVLSPRAEAKLANQLTTGEQLNKFRKDLEAHDSGNQPA